MHAFQSAISRQFLGGTSGHQRQLRTPAAAVAAAPRSSLSLAARGYFQQPGAAAPFFPYIDSRDKKMAAAADGILGPEDEQNYLFT